MKRADNLGKHTPNSDPNSNEHLRSEKDVNFETKIAADVRLAQAQAQAQDPIIESPIEIADLVPPIKDELQIFPRQESGFGDLPESIQGDGAEMLSEFFDPELLKALMESKKRSGIIGESDVEIKGKNPAKKPSIDLSLIESRSTYGSQQSLYQNLLAQEQYDPNIHGSSSRDILGSLAPYSHLAGSELKLSADEQEFIDTGILSYDEILQQRIHMSRYQGQGIFGSQPQSQGLFSERPNPLAQNSGASESMAKSGPATGIDYEFIESQRGLGFSSEEFPANLRSSESLEKELLSGYELIMQTENDALSDDSQDGPHSLVGSEENDHELLDLNDTEKELLESGVSIEDILELREQIAQEQIQPLSAKSLDRNSSQKSPSRE